MVASSHRFGTHSSKNAILFSSELTKPATIWFHYLLYTSKEVNLSLLLTLPQFDPSEFSDGFPAYLYDFEASNNSLHLIMG